MKKSNEGKKELSLLKILEIIGIIGAIITSGISLSFSLDSNKVAKDSLDLSKEAHEAMLPLLKPILNVENSEVNCIFNLENETVLKYNSSYKIENITYHNDSTDTATVNITFFNFSFIDKINVTFSSVNVNIKYDIINKGNVIAEDLNSTIYLGFFSEDIPDNEKVKTIDSRSFVNCVYSNSPVSINLSFNLRTRRFIENEDVALIIRLECIDNVSKDRIVKTHWGKFNLQTDKLIWMTTEEVNHLEPYYLELTQ